MHRLLVHELILICMVLLMRTSLSREENVTSPYDEVTRLNQPADVARVSKFVSCEVLNPLVFRENFSVQSKCCRSLYKTFQKRWRNIDNKLSEWLNLLKLWKCPQFRKECDSPTFPFNDFTNTLYKRFCNPEKFYSECSKKLFPKEIETSGSGSGMPFETDESPVHNKTDFQLLPAKYTVIKDLKFEELFEPCVQASLVEIGGMPRQEKFFEIKVGDLPFCEIVWCALPAEVFLTKKVSISMCMPMRCKVNMYVFMSFAGLLGLAIICTNITVLVVFSVKKHSMNSQRLYKISLAVADLLVGLVVLPTMITTIHESFNFHHEVIDTVDKYGRNITTITDVLSSYEFLGISGFFTTLSLSVSIYTLMVASFDRLMVVYKPLEYNKFRAISIAKILIAIVWILCLIFSLLPFAVDGLFYAFVASVVVSLGGGSALILYSVVMVIPLLIVWGTNIATLSLFKRNAGNARMAASNAQTNQNKTENQLVKTLSIMVGVFTFCLIPLVLLTISQFFVSGIYLNDPKNFNQSSSSIMMSFEAVTVLILMSNSLWNIFIYNGRSPEFRSMSRELLRSITGKIQQQFSCNKLHRNQEKGVMKHTDSTSNVRTTSSGVSSSINSITTAA
uniref:rhodopsin, GQ-coupled-like n=1 Tax=Styela clava TaxID=7725 RepID=UPI00193985B6|nr:rhodopsin, GQ-coupled-like [Styela clava]